MYKRVPVLFLSVIIFIVPLTAFGLAAVTEPAGTFTFDQLPSIIDTIFGYIWPIFIAFSVFMFIRAGYFYIKGKVEDANKAVLWGSIGVGVAFLASSIPFFVKTLLSV